MTLEDFFTLTEVKDGITSLSRIEELINVMQKEKDCVVNTSDAIGQWTAIANTIATTESRDCLDLFVKQGGLQFIDKWLKDAGDLGGNAEDSCVEKSITAFLLALEKLCIDKGGVVPPGIHVTLIKLFGHSSLKVQNRAREVFNKLKLSDRDTISDNFVNTELVNHGSQGSSDPKASVQVEKQIVDTSAEKMLSETPNGIGPEKLQNEMGVEGESSDLPPSILDHEERDHDEKDIKKCKLEEITAGETGKDDVVMMVDKRDSCHENLTVTEASAAVHADEQGGVPSSISEENREVLSSTEKVEEQNNGSSADEIMKSASPGSTGRFTMETASPEESKSLAVEEDKEDNGTEQEKQTEKGICGFDLNEEVGSDDVDCKGDKIVGSEEEKQERNVSLDFDLNMAEVGEGEDSFAGLNPGIRLEKLELDLNSAGEEDDDDVVFLGSRMNKQMLDHQSSHRYASSSSQLHHFQMNLSLNEQPLSGPKSDPFISIMGTKVAIQKEEGSHVAGNGSFMRCDRVTAGPSYSMPLFMMNSSAGPSRPQIELKLGCADSGGGYQEDPPVGVFRQFLPSASEEHHGRFLQPSIVGTKRKEPDRGMVLYP